jgi:GT2 family glycosyltransferase/glycosyltransferase involved in cell wall biosynthesis
MLVIAKTPAMADRSGSDQRLFRILEILAQEVDIDFVSTNHVMRNLREKVNKSDVYYAVRDGNFNRERFEFKDGAYFQALRAIGVNPLNDELPIPLTVRPTNDYDIRKYLAAKTYDLVWVEYFYVADPLVPVIRQFQPWAKLYVDSVDLHYVRLFRQAEYLQSSVTYGVNVKQEREPLGDDHGKKIAEHFSYAQQVMRDELKVYSRVDAVITASPEDNDLLAKHIPAEKLLMIPNIHPKRSEAVRAWDKRDGFVFVGNFDHNPNVSAAIYLKHEVMPALEIPATLQLVGNNPIYLVKTMQKHGPKAKDIRVSGYVPDVFPFLQRARVSLAPILFDAGMSTKIGEAMTAGLPVVTSSLGAKAMGLVHEENCLVADTAAEFAAQATRLHEDEALWTKISARARTFVEEYFSPEKLAPGMRRDFLASFDLTEIRAHQKDRMRLKAGKPLPPPKFRKVGRPEISVILLTYNQWEVTELCLRSLAVAQATHPELPVEFLLVDNASQDGTPTKAKRIANLRVIANKKNYGFAKGNNIGIEAARGRDVVLLNNDTVVPPDWLKRLKYHADTISGLGLLGPSTNTETAQALPDIQYNSIDELFGQNEKIATLHLGRWDTITKISGLCWYLPRATLEKVGLLDEAYGIGYFEDDDYCLRVRDAGLKLACAKDVYVHHFGNMSFEGNSLNRIKILEAGMARFIFKWGKRAMAYLEENHQNTQMQFKSVKEKISF